MQPVVELRLAEVAAVVGVGGVIGIEVLFSFDQAVGNANLTGEVDCVAHFTCGIAGRNADAGQGSGAGCGRSGPAAQLLVGDGHDHCTVDAAGVGNDCRAKGAQCGAHGFQLGGRRCCKGRRGRMVIGLFHGFTLAPLKR